MHLTLSGVIVRLVLVCAWWFKRKSERKKGKKKAQGMMTERSKRVRARLPAGSCL